MKVRLRQYSNPQKYTEDFPDKEIVSIEGKPLTIKKALKIAKDKIAEVRGTTKFIGFKIFDKHGDLKYKLPSY